MAFADERQSKHGTSSTRNERQRGFTTSPKGWVSYRAVEKTKRGGLDVAGHICTDAECRLSIQARYSATAES
jgi:hypothetical protein